MKTEPSSDSSPPPVQEPAKAPFPASARSARHPSSELPAVSGTTIPESGKGSSATSPKPVLTRLRDYELLEEIGRGGMGVVFKARQITLNRCVAVKVIRAGGLASESELKRFKLEAETAAALDHPNIVPIYEIGEFDGLPFFSMRLIEGSSLAANRQAFEKDPRAAARMVAALARTVHHAHERGVLHRDIKPSNVLIDSEGQPHLTDFGLAKRLRSDGNLSLSGAVIGTPNYMSPEQAAGKKGEITTAADIYSLGAVLYEILTGQPPFRADTHTATLQRVIEGDCRRPRSLCSRIDRDLETITLKCLEKDPHRRYTTAEALAEDLERWLRCESIEASRSSTWDRTLKWIRRRPALAALLGVTFGATAVIFALIVSNQNKLRQQRNLALQNAQAATDARQLAERQRYAAVIRVAAASVESGKLAGIGAMLDECQPDLRGWEWGYLRKQVPPLIWSVKAHVRSVAAVAVSPDGRSLATAGEDGLLRLWDAATGRNLGSWICGWPFRKSLAFTPDGQALLACSHHGLLKLDASSGRCIELSGRDTMSFCLEPAGRFCCVAGRGGLETYALAAWRRISAISLPEDEGRGVATDGRFVLTASENSELPMFLLALTSDGGLRPRGRFYRGIGGFHCAVFEPVHRRVAIAAWRTLDLVTIPDWLADWEPHMPLAAMDAKWSRWPKLSLKVQNAVTEPDRPISALASDAEEGWVLSGGEAGEVRAVRSADYSLTLRLPYDANVTALALGSNRVVFAGLSDGSINVRPLAPPETAAVEVWPVGNPIGNHVDLDRSGRSVLIKTDGSPNVAVWSITNAGGRAFAVSGSEDGAACFRPGTDEIVISFPDAVRFYRAETGELRPVRELPARGTADRIVFDQRGSVLAVGYRWRENSAGAGADLFDVIPGRDRKVPFLEVRRDQRLVLDLSADGATLAILAPALKQLHLVGTDSSHAWDRALSEDFDGGGVVKFHPMRRVLACAAADHSIAIWDLDRAQMISTLKGHAAPVISIAFSPDGRRLVSSSFDYTVRVWDWEVSEQLLELVHSNVPFRARFNPDGLALVSSDHEPAVWTRLAVPWATQSARGKTQAADAALFRAALQYLAAFEHADLARSYADSGDVQKAAERYRLARDIARNLRGESDPQTIRFNESLNEMLNRARD